MEPQTLDYTVKTAEKRQQQKMEQEKRETFKCMGFPWIVVKSHTHIGYYEKIPPHTNA